MNIGDNIRLTVEKLVYGNYGLCRHDGYVVFVPFSIPGEEIDVKIVSKKKDYAVGTITEVKKPSSDRIEAPCPAFQICGGCQYQHINYGTQLKYKQEILLDVFARTECATDIQPIIRSKNQYNYRNKTRLKVQEIDKTYKMGFYQKETHQLVQIRGCMLLKPALNKSIEHINKMFAERNFLELKISDVQLHCSSLTGEVLGGVTMHSKNLDLIREFASGLNSLGNFSGLVVYGNDKRMVFGDDFNMEEVKGVKLRISERSFSQVNWQQNKLIIDQALKYAAVKSGHEIFELYSGIGNFSLHFAKVAGHVTGVEASKYSYHDSIFNLEANKIENCKFINSSAEKVYGSFVNRADTILMNPPRVGVTKNLLNMINKPRKIVYISCNPSTLTRDISILSGKGYALNRMQAFDLFPQTHHMETVVELVRS